MCACAHLARRTGPAAKVGDPHDCGARAWTEHAYPSAGADACRMQVRDRGQIIRPESRRGRASAHASCTRGDPLCPRPGAWPAPDRLRLV